MVFVRSLYARLAKWQLALITFVICLIFMLSLFPSMNRGYTMNNDPTVIDLQLSFTEARFSKIVDTWIEHKGIGAVEAFRRVLLTLDYAFPVLYALFLASLSATIVTKFIVKQPGKRDLIFFVLPFAAGLFDLIENTLHLIILGGVNEKGDIHNLLPHWLP